MATKSNSQHNGAEAEAKRLHAGKWLWGSLAVLGAIAGFLTQRRRTAFKPGPPPSPRVRAHQIFPRRGHETHDANAKWIFAVVVFLLVSGLAIHFILAGLLSSLNHTPTPQDRWRPNPQAVQPLSSSLASFPRLQVSPPLDLATFRSQEEAELNSYGWINRSSGIVRVPIERAMEVLLQRGFPVRTSTNEVQHGPSTYQLMLERPEHREPEIKGEK